MFVEMVLLATLVVSGLSFPHPDDSAYKIPEVGTGRRSQYYVLHSDGTFKYGFDTGDGAFESVKSHTLGSRKGEFGYVNPDGKTIRLEYEAGEGGFVARGDHLPKPSPELARALADVIVRSNIPFVDPLASQHSDASYGFRFDSADHSRNEQSDSEGTVTGSYSYVDENGIRRSFTYRAGKGIGFVIEGDGLTQDVRSVTTPTQHQISLKSSAQSGVKHDTVFRSSVKPKTPSRPLGGSVRAYASYSGTGQQANIASTRSETPGDASYSFSYDAGDHSRSETSDSNLNIDGKFSFVADDGREREVKYIAGSGTGFQAEGDHLPKTPEVEFGDRVQTSVRSSVQAKPAVSFRRSDEFSHGVSKQKVSTGASGVTRGFKSGFTQKVSPLAHKSETSYQQTRPTHQQDAVQPTVRFSSFPQVSGTANIRSSSAPQGPYSFSYETSSHSRSESGSRNNEVKGNFAFVAEDDGLRREINYEAGSDTGFIAEGEHIPIGPIVPGAPTGQPTGRIVPVPSLRFVDPLAGTDSDASYNFDFDSETYSRSESADKDGNVVGTYTVVNDDGTRVTYRFRAGKGIGFETEEINRVQGPKPSPAIPYSGPLAGGRSGVRLEVPNAQQDLTRSSIAVSTPHRQTFHKTSSGQSTGSILQVPTFRFVDPLASTDSDASYNFGFDSETYSRSESADKDGNVVGTYTVVNEDGTRVTYRFRAGKGIGFETEEISRVQGPKPSPPVPYSGPLAGVSVQQDLTRSSVAAKTPITQTSHVSSAIPATQTTFHTKSQTHFKSTPEAAIRSSFAPHSIVKSSFSPSTLSHEFPGFILHKYEHSPNSEKFGYVLKFD